PITQMYYAVPRGPDGAYAHWRWIAPEPAPPVVAVLIPGPVRVQANGDDFPELHRHTVPGRGPEFPVLCGPVQQESVVGHKVALRGDGRHVSLFIDHEDQRSFISLRLLPVRMPRRHDLRNRNRGCDLGIFQSIDRWQRRRLWSYGACQCRLRSSLRHGLGDLRHGLDQVEKAVRQDSQV